MMLNRLDGITHMKRGYKMVEKEDIAKAGAVSSVLPYIVVIGGGALAYMYLKDDAQEIIGNSAGRIVERVTESVGTPVENITNIINKGTDSVQENIEDATETGQELGKNVKEGITTISLTPTKTYNNFLEGFYTGVSGSETIGSILKDAYLTGIGTITGGAPRIISEKADSYFKKENNKKSDRKIGEGASSYVGGMDVSPMAVKGASKSKKIKETKSTKAMVETNLKNAESVSLKKDKKGVTRKIIKYKNGVTLRY